MNERKKVAVLGDGAWGTAVAMLLAGNGYDVVIWCYDASIAASINETGYNTCYMPTIKLNSRITATCDIQQALLGVRWVFQAIPVKFLRTILKQAQPFFSPQQVWVILSKGIEQETLLLPSQILDSVAGYKVKQVIFSGPSFAHDLIHQQITAVTLAASERSLLSELQPMLSNDYFRPYLSSDPLGVQVGAALKNVITLGIGMLEGAGYTDNAKAFLLTRGLHEMVCVAVALGGKQETVYGLSGVGDLVLTAMGHHSKNLAVGKQLGKGETVDSLAQKSGGVMPEGVNTVKALYQLITQHNLEAPICRGIYSVLFEHQPLKNMLDHLVKRPIEQECFIA